jgi:hypothetical protein
MSVTQTEVAGEIEIFRHTARTIDQVLQRNVSGFSQQESLLQPSPAGNCLNWVVGHLVCVYNNMLPLLRQDRLLDAAALKSYERGSAPIRNADEALELTVLMTAWEEASKSVDAGLLALTPQQLDSPTPNSPTRNPNETVRSLLATVFFHQAYHVGQAGILRRVAGKDGAIA